jgi:glycosyltransferase involved in cell wall biosynthesis
MFPNERNPYSGIFVKKQIDSLSKKGIDYRLVCLGRNFGGYLKIFSIKKEVEWADVIHAHFGHVGTLAIAWKTVKNNPLVVSYCGSDILGSLKLKERLLARINVLFSKCVDYAIVRSDELSKKIRAKRIDVISSGIDAEIFQEIDQPQAREAVGLADYSGKLILFLGQQNNPVKNFSLFKNALDCLDCEFQYLSLENISHEKVPYYMNAADVCVLTSHYEGSPNVIKEAMACNRPVVSVDVGDVRKVLEGIEGCFVVRPQADHIAEAIKQAMEYKKTAARQRIFDLGLDLDATAEKVIEVYKEVCC